MNRLPVTANCWQQSWFTTKGKANQWCSNNSKHLQVKTFTCSQHSTANVCEKYLQQRVLWVTAEPVNTDSILYYNWPFIQGTLFQRSKKSAHEYMRAALIIISGSKAELKSLILTLGSIQKTKYKWSQCNYEHVICKILHVGWTNGTNLWIKLILPVCEVAKLSVR